MRRLSGRKEGAVAGEERSGRASSRSQEIRALGIGDHPP